MKQSLLLLEDVDGLGRSGEIVSAKPGFARNFLIPQKKALFATKLTVKLQEKLQEERTKQAAIDKKEAEELAKKLEPKKYDIEVKVDKEGNLYGSVTVNDIASLFAREELPLDKKNIILPKPLKKLGTYTIELRLKENVPASITLEVKPEEGIILKKAKDSMKREAELDDEEKKEADQEIDEMAEEAKEE